MWLGFKKVFVAWLMIASGGGALLIVISVIGDIVGMLNAMKLVFACILLAVAGGSLDWIKRQKP